MPNVTKLKNAAGQTIVNVADPVNPQDAATKASSEAYANAGLALKLALAGGTMSGAIAMANHKITGLGTPTGAQDASTKSYVDGLVPFMKDEAGEVVAQGITTGNKLISQHLEAGGRWFYVDTVGGTMVPVSDAEIVNKLYADTKIAKLDPSVQYRIVIDDGAGELEDSGASILDEGEAGTIHRDNVFTVTRSTPLEGDTWVYDDGRRRWLYQNFNGEVRFAELIVTKFIDIVGIVSGLNPPGLTTPPPETLYAGTNIYAPEFPTNLDRYVQVVLQNHHGWVADTDGDVHIHWEANGAGGVGDTQRWGCEHISKKIGAVNTATTTAYATGNHLSEDIVDRKHYVTAICTIPAADLAMSSILKATVWRDGSDPIDTYTGGCWGFDVDMHIQVDAFGSEEEYVK